LGFAFAALAASSVRSAVSVPAIGSASPVVLATLFAAAPVALAVLV
jgi:hypothetical protein